MRSSGREQEQVGGRRMDQRMRRRRRVSKWRRHEEKGGERATCRFCRDRDQPIVQRMVQRKPSCCKGPKSCNSAQRLQQSLTAARELMCEVEGTR